MKQLTAVEDDGFDIGLFTQLINHGPSLIQCVSGKVQRRGNCAALPVRSTDIHEEKTLCAIGSGGGMALQELRDVFWLEGVNWSFRLRE